MTLTSKYCADTSNIAMGKLPNELSLLVLDIYRMSLFSSAEEWGRGRKLMDCINPYDIIQMDLQFALELINTFYINSCLW